MKQEFDFFKTSMPNSRIADYYFGCLDGCVFIDFVLTQDNCVCLKRISFDGYGCCNLDNNVIPMNIEESQLFTDTFKKDDLNQEIMTKLIIGTIEINKEKIWQDALKNYGLIK
jgi:hypothetical protein